MAVSIDIDILRDILAIITRRSDYRRIIPEYRNENDKTPLSLFFKNLLNKELDEDAIAKSIYGSSVMDSKYRAVKSRVLDKILQYTLFVEIKQPEFSEYFAGTYKCMRNALLSRLFVMLGKRQLAVFLAERTLRLAEKYHATAAQIETLLVLETTSEMQWDFVKFESYRKRLDEALVVYQIEHEVMSYTSKFLLYLYSKKVRMTELDAFANMVMARINEIEGKYDSHTVKLNLYRLRYVISEFKREPDVGSTICQHALEYLEANPHLSSRSRKAEFLSGIIISKLSNRKYDHALKFLDSWISSYREGTSNWYYSQDIAFQLHCASGNYETALEVVWTARSNPTFSKLSRLAAESVELYYALCLLLEQLGVLHIPDHMRTSFRLTTFLNSLPVLSKEKRVYNVLVLIAQIGFLISSNRLEEAEYRIDQLRLYTIRYLKDKEFTRTRLFIKLLHSIPRYRWDATEIRMKVQGILKEMEVLLSTPMLDSTMEVIPFETLFELLLNKIRDLQRYY